MRRIWMFGVTAVLLPFLCAANDAGADSAEPDMQVVLVVGVQPGPALWKVISGSHVLWILGEISPYPRKLKWRSRQFERLLRDSQELLIDFSGYWWADAENSALLNKASKLPAGTRLRDLISPELQVRLVATAARFGNPPLEEWHAFAATNRLVSSAMRTLDLDSFSVRFAAAKLGERQRVLVTRFQTAEIPFPERLKNWQHADNEVCLKRLVDAIDDGGSGLMRLANAWSVGDIRALRTLVSAYSFSRDGFRADECAAAMHGGAQQADAYKQRRTQGWLAEADRALKANRSTMAVVLMSELFEPDGYLAGLRGRGYEIVEPR